MNFFLYEMKWVRDERRGDGRWECVRRMIKPKKVFHGFMACGYIKVANLFGNCDPELGKREERNFYVSKFSSIVGFDPQLSTLCVEQFDFPIIYKRDNPFR